MTEETKEIICECGHSLKDHAQPGTSGCYHWDNHLGYTCNCEETGLSLVTATLASERSARILAEGRINKLERVEKIAREICEVVETGAVVRTAKGCKHGNYATAPYNHAWFCDDCWIEMQEALKETA